MLLSELTHMKSLYNDIIYFIQNHVSPVPATAAVGDASARAVGAAVPKLIELDSSLSSPEHCDDGDRVDNEVSVGCFKAGKRGCSVEELPKGGGFKLFGVSLSGRKRLHPEKVVAEHRREVDSSSVSW